MEPSRNLPAVALNQLPIVRTQAELSQALTQLKEHFNVLVPAQMNFSSPLHKVSFEAVQLDPEVDQKGNGVDIYRPSGGNGFTLHYKAANKLAAAANIQFSNGRMVKRDVDNDGRVTYAEFTVAWSVKRVNGSIRQGESTGSYKWEEEKRGPNLNMAEKARRFAEQRAESNAKIRAIFEALDMLPRAFTQEDIKKPFLVPCVVEDLNDLLKDNPEGRNMLLAHTLGITDQIYGPNRQKDQHSDHNLISGATAAVVDESAAATPAPQVSTTTGEIKLSKQEYVESWIREPRQGKLDEVAKLIKAKSFTPAEGTRPTHQMTDEQLVEYLWFLHTRPDPVKAAPLPWEGGK
jgi:hypothetical protein